MPVASMQIGDTVRSQPPCANIRRNCEKIGEPWRADRSTSKVLDDGTKTFEVRHRWEDRPVPPPPDGTADGVSAFPAAGEGIARRARSSRVAEGARP